MNKEDKFLLLKDLCARLPYGIKIKLGKYTATVCEVTRNYFCTEGSGEKCYSIDLYKPYLRPMSSITKDEKEEIKPLFSEVIDEFGKRMLVVRQNKMTLYQDWLNAHYFDYRGLIDKGLAIEAPKGMYNTKTE